MSRIAYWFVPLLIGAGSASAQTPQVPPNRCTGEEYRALDYMVGDWRIVHTANGQLMGSNHVEWVNLGCAIRESLVFPGRGEGTSIYFYSPIDRRWHGNYHDSSGLFGTFLGGIENGKHVITATVRFPQEPQREWRVRQSTFRNSTGAPRQVGERWREDQKAWEQFYDVTFCPKPVQRTDGAPCR